MQYSLRFSKLLEYDPGKNSITVPVALQVGSNLIRLAAKIDTGSSHCIFQRDHGENLELDIESGYPITIDTVTGSFGVFGHPVTLVMDEFEFEVMVYFAKDPAFSRNVLGRHGFLNLVRLGLIDYDGKLYLSRYGDNANGEV